MRSIGLLLLSGVLALALVVGGPAEAADTLMVFGAASLTEFLGEAGAAFEKQHPGTTVRLNLTASSRLRVQIEHGAPADVFLSADMKHMNPLVKAKLADQSSIFAHNRLVIAVPKKNPAGIKSPADLAKPNVKLVVAAPETPIGSYTRTVIQKMDASGKYGAGFANKTLANVRSNEGTVKAVVAKVNLGEADAGICYSSDITPAVRKNVIAMDIPDAYNIVADYPIAVIARSRQKNLANEFKRFVLSPEGQSLLVEHGFLNARPTK